MNLYRKFSLMAVFALGLFAVQYHLLTTWWVQGVRSEAPLSVVRLSLDRLQLSPELTAAVSQEHLRRIVEEVSQQMVQVLPECVPVAAATTARPKVVEPLPPKLYIITPTYRRPEQQPEMTRLSQTLLHVKNIKWLVIEDAAAPTPEITRLLKRTGIDFEHLVAPMPAKYKNKKGSKPRGVSNRNKGIEWIKANAVDGVMYFADDDNTYDVRIFEQMRHTKKVSMWPVGLLTKFGLSTPVVKNGKFRGFYDGWIAGRKFPVDMAEFAVNVKFLLKRPKAAMPYKPGFEEDGFLKSLAPFDPKEVELLANNCSEILVWHTQSKKNPPSAPLNETLYKDTNLIELKKHMV
ncbi:galactosylgalactosylxylosylprotein 3-beta-glucuronosyltransferase P [Neocloeon triangulifer]|uniref:galactosylgalactosylxylosylprotein 3-beta-glucuronosyltransferase P n=1 Tax=Neocloeon triangulifer TaxID=2078957 RepID=UPI00286EFB4C|nr:galactosylgalactosylxylosylprotein 3-beta-glucuronosyltransferase P [Neocloeon triangulifer]XP_059488583.1 galactosylgalactosylxylosylprotein 3-beta-glucuronosyltransferase P [Neocloeon triangulifer]